MSSERLQYGKFTQTFATTAGTTRDLVALGGACCLEIIVGGAGNLVLEYAVRTADNTAYRTDTIPVTAGQVLRVRASKIMTTSTATNVTVMW